MQMVAAGGCLVQLSIPEAASVLEVITRERISILVAVPSVWRSILSDPAASRTDFKGLRIANVASETIPSQLIERVMELTGAVSIQGYGLTEAGLVTLLPAIEARSRLGSAGIPLPFSAVRILRADGSRANPGEEGEIYVRTEYGMAGLWDGERVVSAPRTEDGFMATGDSGWIDQAGYLTVCGRQDDYLKVNGFRVSLAAIEEALRAHPGCADAAAVAMTLPDGRQAPAVLIVPRRSAQLRASELRAGVVAALQPQSAPIWLGIADAIPKTPGTGKARRREIIQKIERGIYSRLID
jgi:acyl-coenzyme A synthetase/AMP-(fatty) acid ligase